MFEVKKELYDFLVSKLDNKELKLRIEEVSKENVDSVFIGADEELLLDLQDFIEDKQTQIGFDEEYGLNESGKQLQQIFDEIYDYLEGL